MLSYLLDENLSPEITRQLTSKRPDIPITDIYEWRAGAFLSTPDVAILVAAAQEGLTLVTFDQKTIFPILLDWGKQSIDHAGVVFVDPDTIPGSDIGGLMRALIRHWEANRNIPAANTVAFLRAIW